MKRNNFSQDWRFYYQDIPGSLRNIPDVSIWRKLELPHDWSIENERSPDNVSGNAGGFFPTGRGWYAKNIYPDEGWHGKKILIEFEGIYMNAEVWLDHHYLGRHPYGYTSFIVDLTPYLDFDKPNLLKVFVDNGHQPNSRWYSGSGIYRPVWLIVAEPVHVAHWGVFVTTPDIKPGTATVNVRTLVENELSKDQKITLLTRIFSMEGLAGDPAETTMIIPGRGSYEFWGELSVTNPRLWSPDQPHLYMAETEVRVDGEITDTETTHFGIRRIEFSAEKGFLLNGEPILLKGGCVHQDNGILGAASYPRSEERKVEMHKASGFNAIRCAHNPPAPSFLDACDRLGMLVINEAFDCWRDGKNHGDYHVVFDDWWKRDLNAMLYRDRNHPSIILWSIGNEVVERDGYGNGHEISRTLADHVRSIDPTRPVTAAICGSWRGNSWEIMDPVFDTLDVGGYNYQWKQYHPDHQRLPERIMVGTESYPLEAFDNWKAVEETPAVIGDFVWTSLDYLGESGIGRVHFQGEQSAFLGDYPWHQANCGDLDLCGFKRPQSFYRDTLWKADPSIYLAVHQPSPEGKNLMITNWGWPDVWPNWNWPGLEGKNLKVDVYTNCDEVELFLNNVSQGRKSTPQKEKHKAMFEVIYHPGELRAIGYKGGIPETEHMISTTGEPHQISLIPDRETIKADGVDLCYISVVILDEDGFLHPTAHNSIFLTLNGPGKILAIGNSNPLSNEPYVGNRLKGFRGRALVVVKSTNKAGVIRLTAQSDQLKEANVLIRTGEK